MSGSTPVKDSSVSPGRFYARAHGASSPGSGTSMTDPRCVSWTSSMPASRPDSRPSRHCATPSWRSCVWVVSTRSRTTGRRFSCSPSPPIERQWPTLTPNESGRHGRDPVRAHPSQRHFDISRPARSGDEHQVAATVCDRGFGSKEDRGATRACATPGAESREWAAAARPVGNDRGPTRPRPYRSPRSRRTRP